jgi:uncharacterized membrane protein YdjX (TVP38/TMEM64 family)
MSARALFKGLFVLVALVFAGFVLRLTQMDVAFNEAWIDSDIRGNGLTGELIFVAVGAAFTAIGLPRQIVSFMGGYAFGFLPGTALALAATACGCVVTFTYARVLGRDFVKGRFQNRVKRIDDFLAENPFSMTLLIRFLPAGSNLVTSLAAGVSSVSAFAFLSGSTIGFIPQTAIFALAGSGTTVDDAYKIGLSVVLFVISGALGYYLYLKFRHGKSVGRKADQEIGLKE